MMEEMDASERVFDFPALETARLVLRVLTGDDATALYHHCADEEVTRFMDIDAWKSVDDARAIIILHANASGCRWGLFAKATGALLGTCGYHCWVQGPHAQAEIGYDLGKAYWGQGLMQEALQAVICFGFAAMHLQRIAAEVHPLNGRSIGLLRRLGFRRAPATQHGRLWFSLRQPDWATRMTP
jgi:ribosomal-protein-alanine N-acetyltransferase